MPDSGLSGCQLTPLSQCSGAVLLEDITATEVAVQVEMVVDRGVNGGKFLQGLDVVPRQNLVQPIGCPLESHWRGRLGAGQQR